MVSRLCFAVSFSGKIRNMCGAVLQQAAPTCPPLAADRQLGLGVGAVLAVQDGIARLLLRQTATRWR